LTIGTHCDILSMKRYRWDETKNKALKRDRGITFEGIVFWIECGGLLDILDHPNQDKYPGQKIYVIKTNDYVYLVPFVEEGGDIFLKTIIPNRKARKKYSKGEN